MFCIKSLGVPLVERAFKNILSIVFVPTWNWFKKIFSELWILIAHQWIFFTDGQFEWINSSSVKVPFYSKHCQTSRTRVRGGRRTGSGAIQARGRRGQDKKLGHFYVVSCKMTIGVESITRHRCRSRWTTQQFPNMEQHVFCPANFLTEAVVVSVAQLPPRPRILPHNNSPGAGLGWAGHRKTTKCQSRSGGRMDGMVARVDLVQWRVGNVRPELEAVSSGLGISSLFVLSSLNHS